MLNAVLFVVRAYVIEKFLLLPVSSMNYPFHFNYYYNCCYSSLFVTFFSLEFDASDSCTSIVRHSYLNSWKKLWNRIFSFKINEKNNVPKSKEYIRSRFYRSSQNIRLNILNYHRILSVMRFIIKEYMLYYIWIKYIVIYGWILNNQFSLFIRLLYFIVVQHIRLGSEFMDSFIWLENKANRETRNGDEQDWMEKCKCNADIHCWAFSQRVVNICIFRARIKNYFSNK